MPDSDPNNRPPVEIQIDPHTYASIEHYATARSLTDQKAAAELVAAGLHLFAATRAGYRLPNQPPTEE